MGLFHPVLRCRVNRNRRSHRDDSETAHNNRQRSNSTTNDETATITNNGRTRTQNNTDHESTILLLSPLLQRATGSSQPQEHFESNCIHRQHCVGVRHRERWVDRYVQGYCRCIICITDSPHRSHSFLNVKAHPQTES